MSTLCLDPSLSACGWAIVENNDILAGGCIVTKKIVGEKISDSDTQRLSFIALSLKEIIAKYSPEKIIFEHPIGSKSSRANQSLSYVKGLVVSACVFSSIKFVTVRAKEVKKKVVGDSNATKDEVLEIMREKFKSFDKIVKDLAKFKMYAVADAVATYLG